MPKSVKLESLDLSIFIVMPFSFWKSSVSLVSENKSAGNYDVVWNADIYPSGMYFVRLDINLFSLLTSILLGLYSETAFFIACDRILFIDFNYYLLFNKTTTCCM